MSEEADDARVQQHYIAYSLHVLVSQLLLAQAQERLVIADFCSAMLSAQESRSGWELKEKSGKADMAVVKDDGLSAVGFAVRTPLSRFRKKSMST